MMKAKLTKGVNHTDFSTLLTVLKCFCWLMIIVTYLWLVRFLWPILTLLLRPAPRPDPVLEEDIPPESSLCLSLIQLQDDFIETNDVWDTYTTYALERNWVDTYVPDLALLGDSIIEDLCGSSQINAGFSSLAELESELFFAFSNGFRTSTPDDSFDFCFFLGGNFNDSLQITCNHHTIDTHRIPDAVVRVCAAQSIIIHPPIKLE